MKISEAGIVLIKKWEGFRARAYRDIVGIWTIGFGSTKIQGRRVQPYDVVTEDEAVDLMKHELEYEVYPVLNQLELNQNQFDALCSFIYNLGSTAFQKSTLRKKIVERDYTGAASQIIRWNRAGGHEVAGLTARRKEESDLFLKEVIHNG